jgi:hypothetical protein
MTDRDEDLIDLDAFAPAPGKRLKFRGRVYTVRNISDIPAGDVFLILRAEQELRGKSPLEQLEVGLRYIAILVPEMDQATLGALSSNQVLRIVQDAMGLAEVPPMGGDGPSGSATSSPSSPGSTDGPGASSAA